MELTIDYIKDHIDEFHAPNMNTDLPWRDFNSWHGYFFHPAYDDEEIDGFYKKIKYFYVAAPCVYEGGFSGTTPTRAIIWHNDSECEKYNYIQLIFFDKVNGFFSEYTNHPSLSIYPIVTKDQWTGSLSKFEHLSKATEFMKIYTSKKEAQEYIDTFKKEHDQEFVKARQKTIKLQLAKIRKKRKDLLDEYKKLKSEYDTLEQDIKMKTNGTNK